MSTARTGVNIRILNCIGNSIDNSLTDGGFRFALWGVCLTVAERSFIRDIGEGLTIRFFEGEVRVSN